MPPKRLKQPPPSPSPSLGPSTTTRTTRTRSAAANTTNTLTRCTTRTSALPPVIESRPLPVSANTNTSSARNVASTSTSTTTSDIEYNNEEIDDEIALVFARDAGKEGGFARKGGGRDDDNVDDGGDDDGICATKRGGGDDDDDGGGGSDDDGGDDDDCRVYATKRGGGGDDDDDDYDVNDDDDDDEDDEDDEDEEDYENMAELDMPSDPFAFITPKMAARARVADGPPIPHSGMDPKEFEAARKKRKAYTDAVRNQKIKDSKSTVLSVVDNFKGDTTEHLRLMSIVDEKPLLKAHTFPDKNTLWLRIAEEANRRRLYVQADRSDHSNLVVFGDDFYVSSTFTVGEGWKVHIAAVREGDEDMNSRTKELIRACNARAEQRRRGLPKADEDDVTNDKEKNPRTPYTMQWVADLLKPSIKNTPNMSYDQFREVLKPYGHAYAFTDSILQDAKRKAKLDLFGSAEKNVTYANGVVSEMIALGHHAKLEFMSRKQVMKRLGVILINEENKRRLDAKEAVMDKSEWNLFVKNWKKENAVALEKECGLADGPQSRFLTGIMFAPSTSSHQVPLLQKVVQADASHMLIGKYTLFSAYSGTANMNMSPVAFAILFGNEDTASWTQFLEFTAQIHPSLNSREVTIVTDQNKGSIEAIKKVLPDAFHFHCSWHRRQNITKYFGNREGTIRLSANWMFNELSNCSTLPSIREKSGLYFPQMNGSH
ncbi:hypothetical protein ACHAWU_008077 [Discostella pseudostelligera]|uniref:MULE transposase domain-containing protein n=1 Tax=Discostella pseudostelligera TaxID=259834 RepID=A0ABD3N7I1_9STRA